MAVVVIWGANNIGSKIAVEAFPPLLALALRFGVVLAALAFWLRPPPRGQWRPFLVTLLVMGPLHYGLQYLGLGLARDISPMVVAMQLWAPASVVFAALLLKEVVGPLRWAGVALAFLGVAWMNFDPVVFAQAGALALVGLAACVYGFGTVLVRRLGVSVGPWAVQGWIALATVPSMLLGSWMFESGQVEAVRSADWLAWAAILFAGVVSSIIASGFVFRLVQRYEVSCTTPYLLLAPVVSFALAPAILGDIITTQMLIGAALTIGGVALVAIAERRLKVVV